MASEIEPLLYINSAMKNVISASKFINLSVPTVDFISLTELKL